MFPSASTCFPLIVVLTSCPFESLHTLFTAGFEFHTISVVSGVRDILQLRAEAVTESRRSTVRDIILNTDSLGW